MRTRVDGPRIGVLLCEKRERSHCRVHIAEHRPADRRLDLPRHPRLPEPLQAEVPFIEDLQEVVEKLRKGVSAHQRGLFQNVSLHG